MRHRITRTSGPPSTTAKASPLSKSTTKQTERRAIEAETSLDTERSIQGQRQAEHGHQQNVERTTAVPCQSGGQPSVRHAAVDGVDATAECQEKDDRGIEQVVPATESAERRRVVRGFLMRLELDLLGERLGNMVPMRADRGDLSLVQASYGSAFRGSASSRTTDVNQCIVQGLRKATVSLTTADIMGNATAEQSISTPDRHGLRNTKARPTGTRSGRQRSDAI